MKKLISLLAFVFVCLGSSEQALSSVDLCLADFLPAAQNFKLTRDEQRIRDDLGLINQAASDQAFEAVSLVQDEGELARTIALARVVKQTENLFAQSSLSAADVQYVQFHPKVGSAFVSKLTSRDTKTYYRNELQRFQDRLKRLAAQQGVEILKTQIEFGGRLENEAFLDRLSYALTFFNKGFFDLASDRMSIEQYRLFNAEQVEAIFDCFRLMELEPKFNSETRARQYLILSQVFSSLEATQLLDAFGEEIKKDSCCMVNCLNCPNSRRLRSDSL